VVEERRYQEAGSEIRAVMDCSLISKDEEDTKQGEEVVPWAEVEVWEQDAELMELDVPAFPSYMVYSAMLHSYRRLDVVVVVELGPELAPFENYRDIPLNACSLSEYEEILDAYADS